MTTKQEYDPTVISSDDVSFVPSRFFPKLGRNLTVATASSLIREFVSCPNCGHDIDPDVSGGVQTDRDVLWTDHTSEHPIRQAVDRSSGHTCADCGSRLELFAEEKCRPSHYSEIPDEYWVEHHLWIKMDDGTYFVTNPSHLSARVIDD